MKEERSDGAMTLAPPHSVTAGHRISCAFGNSGAYPADATRLPHCHHFPPPLPRALMILLFLAPEMSACLCDQHRRQLFCRLTW